MPETPTPEPSVFPVRRVVTGHDADGRPVIVADANTPVTSVSRRGHGMAEVLWFDGSPARADDGGDPAPELRGTFPAGGAAACRLVRWPGSPAGTPAEETWLRTPGDDPEEPGMHRTDTQDLIVVVSGSIVLGLDDGEYELGPGDAVVQRGTRHRWRVAGEQPCVFLSVVLSPEPGAKKPELVIGGVGDPVDGNRLLITVGDAGPDGGDAGEGRSRAAVFGTPPSVFPPAGFAVYDLWQTGGPLADAAQGGTSIPGARWSLEPHGGGVALRRVEFSPDREPVPADWHTTATIDVGVVVSGAFELDLADGGADGKGTTTRLDSGDVVVQRATRHRLRAVGETEACMVSVMFALSAAGGTGG
ncbi:MAG TPA: cupin domain-containing protein [Yinghuangia sp.]|uniref:cupin domain-containing protein n=1 Tax=Yinghuangia sp. YIM S10712 TaxID=3436930 RepID=UPI002C06A3A2|nr:cupin domain-containing protein [Yinghuangia sp.]